MKSLLAFSALGLLFSGGIQATPLTTELSLLSVATTVDSIGVEERDGKRFILHKVTEGQTLYAIARRYNTSVEFIKAANPDLTDAVKYNQIVRVPQPLLSRREERAAERAARREEKAARKAAREEELMKPSEPVAKTDPKTSEKTARPEADSRKSADVHAVEPGQTLYSLALKYNVQMADIRRWNNLKSDNLQAGQTLIVSEKGYAARSTNRGPSTTNDAPVPVATPKAETAPKPAEAKRKAPEKELTKPETKPEPPLRPNDMSEERTPDRTAAKPESNRPEEDRPIRPGDPGNNLPAKGRRVAEIGMAELIDFEDKSNKYLALHRSAPIGSLIQVRNDISNQSMWVKVIGRLPNTGVNERVLVKLSPKAFTKLSPNNQSFRAEVSYMVP